MDALVHTGQTKSSSGNSLTSHSFTSSRGEQVCLLLQVQADTREAKSFEKEITTIIRHSLLETDGDASQRLDGSLKEMNGLMKGLLVSHTVSDVHAIVSVLEQDGTLHVSHAGRAEAYVVRGGSASQITEYTKGKSTPAFVHIASGSLEPRDVIVLSTQRLLRSATPAQLAQLAQREDQLIDELKVLLESDKEQASLAVLHVAGKQRSLPFKGAEKSEPAPERRGKSRSRPSGASLLASIGSSIAPLGKKVSGSVNTLDWHKKVGEWITSLLRDLKDPERKRRAHLLLIAGTVAIFLIFWVVVNLSTSTQRSQTKAELAKLVDQINEEIRTADNRRLTGDLDSSNAILQRAEERAKQVIDNESGLFRMEALDLLDRIRTKREEINNIVRLSPRVVVNIATKNPAVEAQGIIGVDDGEFVAYDKQDLYHILLNSIDDPDQLDDEELIVDGVNFERYQTTAFQVTGNSLIEIIAGQPTSMKTEDPAGWIAGQDMETYLRYLYVLSPENNQIYKYERLSNRYSAPAEYNVNGDLKDALDMAIDGNVYILKKGGEIVKLFRGEVRPFVIRHAPDDVLETATKIYKPENGNVYFLDPVQSRVIIVTGGGETGESSYVKQYIFEGDQIGTLKDFYVDPDETRLYVLDEKRLYAVDL